MENKQIIEKILTDTKALMTLKVDNEEVVKDKFRLIKDRVEELYSAAGEGRDHYLNAFTLIQAAMDTDYRQFSESTSHTEKEQALIQLRHKAAEVCEILQSA